jgi:hypothetical protein
MLKNTISIMLLGFLVSGCLSGERDRPFAKFEPRDGEVILFVGQELDAIGGLDDYNDGYLDHFQAPGGFTMYTSLTPGNEMFGQVNDGLDGVYKTDNWGDGDSNMSLQLADPNFEHMALAIGLWLVDQEDKVGEGERDDLIKRLGEFFLELGDRPVFLRIGYEFDGYDWNHYEVEPYKAAFRRIKDVLDGMGVQNVAYVWQSTGWGPTVEHLEEWYPGDEYVDWTGYSFFSRWDEQKMIEFSRSKGKPVFIAEATPTISTETTKVDGVTKETILSNPQQAEEAWEKWFTPLFTTIDENPDVVKAVSYINAHWKSRPMWKDNPTFKSIDARLHTNQSIADRWEAETSKGKYLKASPGMFEYLANQ